MALCLSTPLRGGKLQCRHSPMIEFEFRVEEEDLVAVEFAPMEDELLVLLLFTCDTILVLIVVLVVVFVLLVGGGGGEGGGDAEHKRGGKRSLSESESDECIIEHVTAAVAALLDVVVVSMTSISESLHILQPLAFSLLLFML